MQAVKPSPSLIALKPRQVLLSSNPTMKAQASAPSLTPQQSSLLLLSVAHFLQRKSFSKTLKKFLSEAQIQKNDLTGSSLDLEEMCCKYLAMSDPSSSNLNKEQLHDKQGDENPNSDGQVDNSSTFTKKKKKRGNESSVDNIAGQSEVDDKSANPKKIEEQVSQEAVKESATDVIGGLQSNECAKKGKEKKKKKIKLDESHVDTVECNGGSDAGIEGKTKDKKKKKNKLTSDSLVEDAAPVSEDTQLAATTFNANDIPLEDKTSKSKKKKKKDDSEDVEKVKSKDDENEISKVDSTVADKSSKKRKRLDSEVHDTQPANENAIEDSKRRKTDATEEQLNSPAGADKHVGKENGNIEKNGKHSEQKSSKKQQNGSAQPKKPFQRVNVEEVVFVDTRLEDNSYWAKDGAETGYGAKAQEVLGQVRGRGFRHEKTKKKRGSYRGGQIDFDSHSVKFNYSDDE
ncbi:hypothetical protein HRI_003422700 [Hibiscus trionum]|uniref:Srp40 C-terminal domain-containing protein n=1 Tax=Hibiscus trionum TaxID=183268 RepID=A0A9W7MET2_HIBTR|nr:hypothetical protein HRI_003422700 [Hibiscus trionum]